KGGRRCADRFLLLGQDGVGSGRARADLLVWRGRAAGKEDQHCTGREDAQRSDRGSHPTLMWAHIAISVEESRRGPFPGAGQVRKRASAVQVGAEKATSPTAPGDLPLRPGDGFKASPLCGPPTGAPPRHKSPGRGEEPCTPPDPPRRPGQTAVPGWSC